MPGVKLLGRPASAAAVLMLMLSRCLQDVPGVSPQAAVPFVSGALKSVSSW